MFDNFKKILIQKLSNALTSEPPNTDVTYYDFNRLKYELKPGDVILVEGRSRVAKIIRRLTHSSWTHAMLYLGRQIDYEDEEIRAILRKHTDAKESTRLIIEGLMDRGTVLTKLNFYKHHHLRICRPIGITPADMRLVILYAIKALGQPYNVRHLLDLTRFMLPWGLLPRRWRSSLFRTRTGEPEPGICSSLIAEAFSSVHFPIIPFVRTNDEQQLEVFQRNPHLFTPKDFDYSPYFEIIKYPLFNPDEPLPYYRRLPWSKSGYEYQDDGIFSTTASQGSRRLPIFTQKKTTKHADTPEQSSSDSNKSSSKENDKE